MTQLSFQLQSSPCDYPETHLVASFCQDMAQIQGLFEVSKEVGKIHLEPSISFLIYAASDYPVVIINWVQYLGPPGPFSFPDSRGLLEVLGRLSLAEREP